MIGLRRFETEHLLIELFYFTFVVVITAIQLSIFHKRYTAQFMLKPTKKRTISDNAGRTSNTNECSTPKKTFVEKVSLLWLKRIIMTHANTFNVNKIFIFPVRTQGCRGHWVIYWCQYEDLRLVLLVHGTAIFPRRFGFGILHKH